MPQLSEWLKLMNAEIARKRDDETRAREEEARRQLEQAGADHASQPAQARSRKTG